MTAGLKEEICKKKMIKKFLKRKSEQDFRRMLDAWQGSKARSAKSVGKIRAK